MIDDEMKRIFRLAQSYFGDRLRQAYSSSDYVSIEVDLGYCTLLKPLPKFKSDDYYLGLFKTLQ